MGAKSVSLPLLLAGALALLTLFAFLPVLGNGFVLLDDAVYVTGNARVNQGLTGESLSWVWSANVGNNWHPLTVLSHMLDCQIFGLEPAGHHLTSLLLHLANVLLLFEVLRRMTGAAWPSAAAAALFAIHPLHVESVAWVAERKDVLSTCFWILAMGAYTLYVRRPSTGRYLLVALAMVLGLMAKPMVVTLPLALLLLDVWPLGRLRLEPGWGRRLARLAIEKLPLLGLSAAASVITLQYQTTSLVALEVLPWRFRLANAAVSYATYLGKTLLPRNLAVFYPIQFAISPWKAWGAAALIAALTALVVWRMRKSPWLLVGWLWFLGTLVPVIGLIQVGRQAMADRYTYIPSIGLFLAVCWELRSLAGSRKRRAALAAAAVAAILALTAATRQQVRHWSDSISLFRHAVEVTHDNYVARLGLAKALAWRGDWTGAAEQYRAVLVLRPRLREARKGLDQALREAERRRAFSYRIPAGETKR
jgi:protein O-mannosyl-transferase